jgi:hypothetical protein
MKRFAAILFLSFLSYITYSQNQYSISKEIKPMKIEYSEFVNIIRNLNHLLQKYDSLYSYSGQSLVIENTITRQIIESYSPNDKMSFDKAFKISFQYSNYRGLISKVDIEFNDAYREIRVTGQSLLEVETLINFLEKEFNKRQIFFGGMIFRMGTGIGLFLLSIVLALSYSYKIKGLTVVERDKRVKWRIYSAILLYVFTLLCILGVFKFNLVFPGFLIYTEEIGFISKHADQFTFWSFILALIALFGIQLKPKIKD